MIPELDGKLDGISMRVPTPVVSVLDLVVTVEKPATKEEINTAYKKAASSPGLSKYLQYCDEPLVSRDFIGNSKSCIFDSLSTEVLDSSFAKVFGWYDNEWGYSNRVVDLVDFISSKK